MPMDTVAGAGAPFMSPPGSGPIIRSSAPLEGKINMLAVFPSTFAFSCLLMFVTPMFSFWTMDSNASIRYWIGRWCLLSFIPLLIITVGYVIHTQIRGPNKATVVSCLIIPCLLNFVIGEIVYTVAKSDASGLLTHDCNAFEGKVSLQASWKAAYDLHQTCIEAAAKADPKLTKAAAQRMYTVKNCEGYEAAYKNHRRDWKYLEALENDLGCGGFCYASPGLWTNKPVLDSCSIASGQDLSLLGMEARQNLLMNFLLLGFFSACLVQFGNAVPWASIGG